MSLINDVLRDLEERRGGLMPGREAVLSGLRPSEPEPQSARRWGWPVALLAALLLPLLLREWPGPAWPLVAARGTPAAVAEGEPAVTGGDLSPPVAGAAEAPPADTVAPVVERRAEAADSSPALPDGLLEEATRELVRATLRVSPSSGVVPLEEIGPEALRIDPAAGVGERLALAEVLPWQALAPAPGRAGPGAAGPPPAAGRQAPVPPAAATGPATSPVSAAGRAEAAVVVRRPSTGDHRERLRRATLAWRQGRVGEARRLLTELLRDEPSLAPARLLLARILAAAGRRREADGLLREGAGRDPGNPLLAMAWARRLAERGELQAALEALRRAQGEAAADARYQAFLAALSQRAGRHQEAIEAWRRALIQRQDEGTWHLGLAISLQALGRYEEAAQAYRRTVGDARVSASLRRFARERLARLERRSGE